MNANQPAARNAQTDNRIVYRESFVQRLYFVEKPDETIRNDLKAAGWRYDPTDNAWVHTENHTEILLPRQLAKLLRPQPEKATA